MSISDAPIDEKSAVMSQPTPLRRVTFRDIYQWTYLVENGLMSPFDVIVEVNNNADESHIIQAIRLRELFASQPNWTGPQAEKVVREIIAKSADLNDPKRYYDPDKVTVGWLVNELYPERFRSFLDVIAQDSFSFVHDRLPWAGYPAAPVPTKLSVDVDVAMRTVPDERNLLPLTNKNNELRHTRLSNIRSPLKGTGVAQHERVDPMHAPLWGQRRNQQSPYATWGSMIGHARKCEQRGRTNQLLEPETALRILCCKKYRAVLLDVLSVLNEFGVMTTEQLAAFTGFPTLAPARNRLVMHMFAAGLIDIGVVDVDPLAPRSYDKGTCLVRITRETQKYMNMLLTQLTWFERLYVTCGMKHVPSSASDRHNVLVNEALLRIAESCSNEVALVLGERHAGVDFLTSPFPDVVTKLRRKSGASTQMLLRGPADGVVIRGDGRRIFVELCASNLTKNVRDSIEQKIDRWQKIMRELPSPALQPVVLFLVATREESSTAKAVSKIEELINDKVRAVGFAKRFAVVAWDEWWPAEGQVADGLRRMNARFFSPDAKVKSMRREILNANNESGIASTADHVVASALPRLARFMPGPWWLKLEPSRVNGRKIPRAELAELPLPVDLNRVQLRAAGLKHVPSVARTSFAGNRRAADTFRLTRFEPPPVPRPDLSVEP